MNNNYFTSLWLCGNEVPLCVAGLLEDCLVSHLSATHSATKKTLCALKSARVMNNNVAKTFILKHISWGFPRNTYSEGTKGWAKCKWSGPNWNNNSTIRCISKVRVRVSFENLTCKCAILATETWHQSRNRRLASFFLQSLLKWKVVRPFCRKKNIA